MQKTIRTTRTCW